MFVTKNEKEFKAFLITWVTHNSRISERMIEYKVQKGEPFILDYEMRNSICRFLNEKIAKEGYQVLAKNVLHDHVHLVLICAEHEIANIIQNLKGYTSFFLGKQLLLSKDKEGRQNKIWAKGSNYSYLDKEKHLLNSIEYTNNNHLKHDIPMIDRELQFAEVCRDFPYS